MAYIDRDKAIRHLRGVCVAKYPMSFLNGIFASADEIDKLPTADVVELKHAHWREGRFLKVGDSVKGYPSVICSDCGITFCDIINNHNYMYRYCPNCGAKMRGDT